MFKRCPDLSGFFLRGASVFLRKGFPRYDGEFSRLPLIGSVEVLRDKWGIPHIYAENLQDLLTAQGFVHSQDRLWQMETFRRMAQGRLSEIAGEDTLLIDQFVRLLGLPELRKRALSVLEPEDVRLLEAYVRGVNAFLEIRGRDLPLEFRKTGLVPEAWGPEDPFSTQALFAWFMQTNYAQELFALKAGSKLDVRDWNDLYPSYPGARLPEDRYFDGIRKLRIGPLEPSALAFFESISRSGCVASGAGSNNWVVAKGRHGKPLLANDPHLPLMVPGMWYLCHLCSPDLDAAGASLAGSLGVMIGFNEKVAWGFTNVETDNLDLFVVRIDPDHPLRYRVGDTERVMDTEQVEIGLPRGKKRNFTVYRTQFGPVITRVERGLNAAVALKTYGTLPEKVLVDRTMRAFLDLNRSGSVGEALKAGRNFGTVSMNLVTADAEGHIGWHVTGAVPLRRGYSGRLPADGSSGYMDWTGFIPYDKLPHCMDPPEGWIATANHRVIKEEGSPALTYSWVAPYRYNRIVGLLSAGDTATVEGFRRMQMDVHSLQAERLLPKILSFDYADKRAREAVSFLKNWDREVRAESTEACIYEVFINEWVRILLEHRLDECTDYYINAWLGWYTIEDVILDRPESGFWNKEDRHKNVITSTLESALIKSMEWLERRLGPDRGRWRWGRLHRYVFRHPAARGWLASKLLNRGPYPSHGDNATLNVAGFIPLHGDYDVKHYPSLRMIVPLGEPDRAQIVAPMGQSGQPGHSHYDDMLPLWLEGGTVTLPLRRPAVEAAAVHRLVLKPRGPR